MASKDITTIDVKKLLETTPPKYIKKRKGRGGTTLSYVETGYIIQKLNEIFNYRWSFEVTESTIGESQVYVKGRLTAYVTPELAIVKEQYGGKDVAKNASTGKAIDIGDDMKAAGSDALKKCASLFGISQDVFWPSGKEYHDEIVEEEIIEPVAVDPDPSVTPQPKATENEIMISPTQKTDMISLLSKKGKTILDLSAYITQAFGKDSHQNLTYEEAEITLKKLRSMPNKKGINE